MISDSSLNRFTTDVAVIDRRLYARLTLWELFAVALALGIGGIFGWLQVLGQHLPNDYSIYLKTPQGIFDHYYYSYWFIPVFSLLNKLPISAGYILWNAVNILGIFFASRVFGGRAQAALLTYQMFYVLFYGQITGILIGGLALCWWGMAHRRWNIAGLGLIIACTKYQIGLTLGLSLWLIADVTWYDRLRVLVVPVIIAVLSLVTCPLWPLDTLVRLQVDPPNDWGSVALWRWIGPAALLLWLPPVLLPLSREKRFIALASTTALALPYFQQMDLLSLFVLPVGWLALLGNLGYLFILYDWWALQILAIIPLVIYAAIIVPATGNWVAGRIMN